MAQRDFQKNLQNDSETLEYKIRRHEDNLKFLKTQIDHIDKSILDLQVILGRYHSTKVDTAANEKSHSEEETTKQILQQETSAAGVLCQITTHHLTQLLNMALTKDVLGIVATIGSVNDDKLSRLLSEYLGLDAMLAIVCRSYEGVKALEKYDGEGKINSSTSLHGLASSIGRKINGRFLVISLEDLRPYVGNIEADDPQRKLALPKPKLPTGECPSGFLDFAVNQIHVDDRNLSYLTSGGYGLRETLLYNLFSQLQIYRTRNEMLLSLSCITDGALSLDGGMIKRNGVFALGNRKDVKVRFPITSGGSNLSPTYIQTENMIRKLKWERFNLDGDVKREQVLLDHTKINFTRRP